MNSNVKVREKSTIRKKKREREREREDKNTRKRGCFQRWKCHQQHQKWSCLWGLKCKREGRASTIMLSQR